MNHCQRARRELRRRSHVLETWFFAPSTDVLQNNIQVLDDRICCLPNPKQLKESRVLLARDFDTIRAVLNAQCYIGFIPYQ